MDAMFRNAQSQYESMHNPDRVMGDGQEYVHSRLESLVEKIEGMQSEVEDKIDEYHAELDEYEADYGDSEFRRFAS